MAKFSQKKSGIIGEKQGVPVYSANPSIPNEGEIRKNRKGRLGDERNGMIVDNSTGEILGQGGAITYQWEEVDDTRFVKLFLAGIKQAAGLTKSGLTLFEVIYKYLQARPGEDKVILNYYTASEEVDGLTERTYRRGLRELLDKEFLYRSPSDGVFFVNIRYMFNGDRLAFVKGYQRKGSQQQHELPLLEEGDDE